MTACPGCTGCIIQRQLNERETFTRAEVAHLLALAFRSGGSLAYEMAGDIVRWADEPFVRRTARQQYERRMQVMAVGAERQRAVDVARKRAQLDVEWPPVAVPGAPDEW